jgi:hypothetical protein
MDRNDKPQDSKQHPSDFLSSNTSSVQLQTSFLDSQSLTSEQATNVINFSQISIIPQTAAVYFCFEDDKFDKPENPNKIILAKAVPTVQDFCATLKSLFYPNQDVTMSCTFNNPLDGVRQTFSEDSQVPVPSDRDNVVMIKVKCT